MRGIETNCTDSQQTFNNTCVRRLGVSDPSPSQGAVTEVTCCNVTVRWVRSMNDELDKYEVEFDMRRTGKFMQQLNFASAFKSVVTPSLCVNTTDERKTTDRRTNSCFRTSLLARHTFWLRTELTVQKKHPVPCRRLLRLVSTVWCTATHPEACGSAHLQDTHSPTSQSAHALELRRGVPLLTEPFWARRTQEETSKNPDNSFFITRKNPARALQAF